MFPIAATLIAIGLILIIVAVSFLGVSFHKEEITEKIHDNDRIQFWPKADSRKRLYWIFPLKHKCKMHVQLNPTSGPFDFAVVDFVGFPIVQKNVDWRIKYYYAAQSLPKEGPLSFTLVLEPGLYSFVFARGHEKAEVSATLTSTATYTLKPLEKLLDVGLQLLQVGIPILITGLVLYIGLSSPL